jgi:RNA-directed DNA polymerase
MTKTHNASDPRVLAVAEALARAFLAGEPDAATLRKRGVRALGRSWKWLPPLVRKVADRFGHELGGRHYDALVATIAGYAPFRAAFAAHEERPEVRGFFNFHPTMDPPALPLAGPLPALDTPGDLARWLGISPIELDWFADLGARSARVRAEALRHYRYRWIPKASGGVRLLESPKPRLREIQRRILHEILDRVPAATAAHGCVKGRSTLTHAGVHAKPAMLIRLDLADFFPSVPAARVQALFRTLGYPARTSLYLAALATHTLPNWVLRERPRAPDDSPDRRRQLRAWTAGFRSPHLPQGAPTSPALANLAAYRLDLRLAGAARASGALYTRCVDDLYFSYAQAGHSSAQRLIDMAYGIILEEGFTPNYRKTRTMSRSTAQYATGIVVNEHPNASRAAFDQLKAVLTNCVRQGPRSQNRERRPNFRAHLEGRVAHMIGINPLRGHKLRRLLGAIAWGDGDTGTPT